MRNNSVKLFSMSFKRFLNCSSGGPPVQWSGIIYAILEEGIMGNFHVKLF